MINIVLVEPEIPQNTGNIARTCAATGCVLHLVEPLGFQLDDRRMKRAGLDYWHLLDVRMYKNLEDFFEKNPDGRSRSSSSTPSAACASRCARAREASTCPTRSLSSFSRRCVRPALKI